MKWLILILLLASCDKLQDRYRCIDGKLYLQRVQGMWVESLDYKGQGCIIKKKEEGLR